MNVITLCTYRTLPGDVVVVIKFCLEYHLGQVCKGNVNVIYEPEVGFEVFSIEFQDKKDAVYVKLSGFPDYLNKILYFRTDK